MLEYQKIPGPYKRYTEGPYKNKVDINSWADPDVEYLASIDADWVWTEKVDGTNIRVNWDGHKIAYGGRTENAQIPAKLLTVLDSLFKEELFEQKFGGDPVTLYGEGYGAGIQSGGIYRPDMSFILFDVRIGSVWLLRDSILDIGKSLGVDVVPELYFGAIFEAIDKISYGLSSRVANKPPNAFPPRAEGLVGITPTGLLNRQGRRIIVKLKDKDFYNPLLGMGDLVV